MARLIVVDQPHGAREVHAADRLIDWLQTHHPRGFAGLHRATLNGAPLAVADYDRPLAAGDEVRLYLYPAGPVIAVATTALAAIKASWWASALASALIGTIASYAVNALFGTKPPKRGDGGPAPSPTYSLGVPQVQARLGAPIPVQYGRVIATPDLASQPYTRYENNDQYLYLLLCLGQGDYTVHGLSIADTPADQLASGVIDYQVYGPSDHGQTMGVIRAASEADIGATLWEDVDTSPEVADQELVLARYQADQSDVVYDHGSATLYLSSALPAGIAAGSTLYLRWPGGVVYSVTVGTVAGDRLSCTVSGSVGDPTVWTRRVLATSSAGSNHTLTTDEDTDDLPSLAGASVIAYQYGSEWSGDLDDDSIAVDYDLTAPAGGGAVTGTISADLAYTEIIANLERAALATWSGTLTSATTTQLELAWSSGEAFAAAADTIALDCARTLVDVAWSSSAGTVGPFSVCAPGRTVERIEVDVVWPGGLYSLNKKGQIRGRSVTLQITLTPVDDDGTPLGAATVQTETVTASDRTTLRKTFSYAVTAGRYTAAIARTSAAATGANEQDQCIATALRGVLTEASGTVYGETTLLAVRIKASNGIASDAASRLTVDCTRQLGGVATRAAADAFTDLWSNATYGGGRAAAELDTAGIAAWRVVDGGDSPTAGFDFRFDVRGSLWDALRAIARPSEYFPIPLGSLISVAGDVPAYVPSSTRAFTQANISNPRLAYGFDGPDEDDGFEVEYRDATDGRQRLTRYPTSSVRPEAVVLAGCVQETIAARAAEALWLKRQYRRRWLTFDAELEGHLIEIGRRITITHEAIGTVEAVVAAVRAQDEFHTEITAFLYDARQYVS